MIASDERDDELRFVLDSFALLAHFEGEVGAPVVKEILTRAEQDKVKVFLSIINLGEAAYITEREQGLTAAEQLIAAVDQLAIEVIVADRKHTLAAAHLKAHYPIAYADAFALALAVIERATLVTGDPEFRSTGALAPILWLSRT